MTKTKNAIGPAVLIAVATVSAWGAILMANGNGVMPPAPGEFGLGPRTSAQGLYSATIQTTAALKPRKMYTLQVAITDAAGKPIDNATIAVDGGMPQHGHGLPTRPRVTKNLRDGVYEISGVRFNMGGWWELKLAITTPAGTDTVTFNLSL